MKVFEIFNKYATHDLANPTEPEVRKIDKVEDLVATIQENCKTAVKAYQDSGEVLYRGMKAFSKVATITGIRPDRKPVEMNKDWHAVLHAAFIKAGLKATRKNSIFCTTSMSIAEAWGDVYIIFPKDKWNITIFEEFVDGYTFYKFAMKKYDVESLSFDDKVDYMAKYIQDKMGSKTVNTTEGLSSILKMRYEDILLRGDSYIALLANNSLTSKVLKELNIRIN